MSNFDSDNDFKKNNNLVRQQKLKWKAVQTDLKSALNDWQHLETGKKLKSPEEEQLEKVKSIIENIKEKLNGF